MTPQAAPAILVVRALFNREVTGALRDGATAMLQERGATLWGGEPLEVAGAWEALGAAARAARAAAPPDGILVLAAIIQGKTEHHTHLANAVFTGLANLQADTGLPIGLGILTTATVEQARARAGGPKGNKGAEAAAALLGLLEASP